MMLSVVLTADQFATHESAAGRHPEDVPGPPEPDREQTAQDAYLVAVRARDALGMDGADLIVLVVQAFLLDMDVAADVALAASQGHELATVDLKL